jgi:phosphoserine aminotransferase
LKWASSIGGLEGMQGRADQNLAVLADWVAKTDWVDFLAATPDIRSNTSVCLKVVDPQIAALPEDAQADFAKKLASLLEKEGAALDIGGYRDAPAGLRIWCGATVEASDLEALTPWLDWAFAETKAAVLQAA